MSVMTAQPPLPLTPVVDAVQIGSAVDLVEDAEGGRVFIYGVLSFAWDADDQVLRRLAAVQLVRIQAGLPWQVAAGFGVNTATLYRWRQHADQQGASALVPGKRGPKGPSRLTDEVIARIWVLREQGASLRAIGAELGLSTSTVRVALHGRPETGSDPAAGAHPDANTGAGDRGDGADHHQPAVDETFEHRGAAEQSVGAEDDDQHGELEVLATPVARAGERALAWAGQLGQASPVFTPAARAPLAGLMLGLPGLADSGLLSSAQKVYGRLPQGFYGLNTVLLEAVFRTLAGAPRAEGASRLAPSDLGRVLGMDRAPEVKTIRRKISQLAAAGKAAQLQEAIGAHHIAGVDDSSQMGLVFYVDGHTRVYQGTKRIGKTHIARLKHPAPATAETWISDADGAPVMMVMAEPGASLASELRRLLPDLRAAVGDQRRVLVGFDRGGWSPALFAHMHAAGFDVLTWAKQPTDDHDDHHFQTVTFEDETGRGHQWELAESTETLKINKAGDTFTMRKVSRRDTKKISKKTGQPRQVHILTTRQDLSAAEVVYRMGSRWRQENYFRYGRLHLDLDSHDTYSSSADDPTRSVPNPAKTQAHNQVKATAAQVEREHATANAALLAARTPAPGKSQVLITSAQTNEITAKWRAAADAHHDARLAHALTPTRIRLGELAPDQQVLDTETKLITHAIKIAAYNTITSIATAIRSHTSYARAEDEAYTLARQVLTHTGDINPRTDGELLISLDPMPTPRATKAVTELCEHLTNTKTLFPGSNRTLRFRIKTHT